MPLITRRSSTRALPRVSVGRCGLIFENCAFVSQTWSRLIYASFSEAVNHATTLVPTLLWVRTLIPSIFWLISLGGIYLYNHHLYQGSLLVWPFLWIYILFAMGNTSLGVVGTWLSELYPVDVRATAVSTIYMAGRAVGSIAPVVVPMIAAYAGDNLVMGLMIALPAGLIFIVCTLLLPETRGRDLAGTTRVTVETASSSASSYAH